MQYLLMSLKKAQVNYVHVSSSLFQYCGEGTSHF